MLRRMKEVLRFIKGDFIVLKIERDKLIVDAQHFEKEQVREVASTFFARAYNL